MRTGATDEDGKLTLRYQAIAIARDVLTISAVLSVVGSIFWVLASPYLKPFLELPEKVAQIQAQLAPISDPKLVEFQGIAMILNRDAHGWGHEAGGGFPLFKRGQHLLLLYNLRRNADCATQIEVTFIDIRSGSKIVTGTLPAVQAPVTTDFTYFILQREIPANLPPGLYTYYPRIVPVNCGVYRPFNGNMSEIFEVTS